MAYGTGKSALVSRRSLLAAGVMSGLAVGAGTAVLGAKPPGDRRRTRELGFYLSPRDGKFPQRLAWLREHGVRAIGLDGGGPNKPAEMEQIARAIEGAVMRVVAIHGTGAMAHPENNQKVLQANHLANLEKAAAWKAEHLIVHFRVLALPWREGVGFAEADYITKVGLEAYDARVLELLNWLCAEAASRKIRIALENLPIQHQFSYRAEEIVAMIERCGTPNVGICLDSGHAHLSHLDVAAAIRTAGRHLTTTHLHDNLGGGDPRRQISQTDLHLCVGLGTINWPAAIRALDDSGYQGPAVIEGTRIGPKQSPDDTWEKSVQMAIDNYRAMESLAAEVV